MLQLLVRKNLLKNQIEQKYLEFIANKLDNDEFREHIKSQGYSNESIYLTFKNNFKEYLNNEDKLRLKVKKMKKEIAYINQQETLFILKLKKITLLLKKCTLLLIVNLMMMRRPFIADEAQEGNVVFSRQSSKVYLQKVIRFPSNVFTRSTYTRASKDQYLFSNQEI